MRRLIVYLMSVLFLPSLCLAEVVVFQNGKEKDAQTISAGGQDVALGYGSSSLTFIDEPIEKIVLDKKTKRDDNVVPFFESLAEAAAEPSGNVIREYLKAHQTIQSAWRLDDLNQAVSRPYFNRINSKVHNGAHQATVLTMLQNMRPDTIEITDAVIEEERAQIAATGSSSLGKMHGVVRLVKEEARWRIDRESWYSDRRKNLQKELPLAEISTQDFIEYVNTHKPRRPRSIRSLRPNNYYFDNNPLALRDIPGYQRDEAFMFIFVVERGDNKITRGREDPYDMYADKEEKGNIHVLWTGPKELLPGPQSFQTDYPMDVSIADDDDGYRPGDLNLRLPEKRPREVCASFLLSF